MHIYGENKYPSVTEILKRTSPKAEIVKWAKIKEGYEKKNGEGSWEMTCETGRIKGTAVHRLMDLFVEHKEKALLFLKEGESEYSAQNLFTEEEKGLVKPYLAGCYKYYRDILSKYEVVEKEKTLICNSLQYGGTSDILVRLPNNKLRLCDYKTFKGYQARSGQMIYRWDMYKDKRKVERSKERIKWEKEDQWNLITDTSCRNAFLQIMLYAHAYSVRGINPYVPDELCICVISPLGVQEIVLPYEAHEGCKKEALDRVKQFHELVSRKDFLKEIETINYVHYSAVPTN